MCTALGLQRAQRMAPGWVVYFMNSKRQTGISLEGVGLGGHSEMIFRTHSLTHDSEKFVVI